MAKTRIKIATLGDLPSPTVERELGQLNFGFYCDGCDEFVAVAVLPPQALGKADEIEFHADGPVFFDCPACSHLQQKATTDIVWLILTADNQKRPRARVLH